MPRYCFDTSGLSKALQDMPSDVFESLWAFVEERIETGDIAVTREIYEELILIDNGFGQFIAANKDKILFEVNQDNWDWNSYLTINAEIVANQYEHISEYSGGSPKTVCLNDVSGVSLAKALGLPLVSGESITMNLGQAKKRKIPDVCNAEDVLHMTFNDFLKAEGYKG